MPTIDVVDETYLRASLRRVADVVHEGARWSQWWPDLVPAVFMDRGDAGIRWNVTGSLVGSMEIWLETYSEPLGGVLMHYYLRADPTGAGSSTEAAPLAGRAAVAESARWAKAGKQNWWLLKDELEAPGKGIR